MRRALVAGFLVCALLAGGFAQAATGTALMQARALVTQKHYVKALEIYRGLLKAEPDNADLLIETARVYGWNDQNAQAAKLYERVLKVAPARRKDVLLSLSWQLLWARQPQPAAQYFTDYLKAHPDDLKARLGLAEALSASGHTQAALTAYRAVLSAQPDNMRARLGVARALVREHHYDAALTEYRRLLAVHSHDADLLIETAQVYGWNNQNADAARLYQQVLQQAPDRAGDVDLPLAWQLLWSQQAATAVPYFQEYVRGHPKDAKARLGLAEALMYSGHWRSAGRQYRQVLHESPQNWRAQLGVARALVKRKDYPKALDAYREVLLARPRDPNLLIEVARVYGWNNENRRSAELYRRVIDIAPARRRDVELALAWQLLWSQQPAGAVPYFRDYLARHPADHHARLGLAEALMYSGRWRGAQAQYRAVLHSAPQNWRAQLGVARALVKRKDYPAALNLYRKVLLARPRDANLLIEVARVYGWNNENRRSAQLYRRVLEVAPGRRRDVERPLAFQLLWSHQAAAAVPYFRAVLARRPGDVKARLGYAQALAATRDSAPALAQFRRVLAAEPANWAARLGAARMLVREHRYPAALADYRQLVKRRPGDSNLLIETARVYGWNNENARSAALYERVIAVAPQRRSEVILPLAWQLTWSGQAPRAVPLFKEDLTAHPDDLKARVGLGDALADTGQLQAALGEYRAVLARKPDQLDAQYGEARVLGWLGRYREADHVYRAILARHPDAFAAKAGLARVRNWRGQHRAAARSLEALVHSHPGDAGLRHDLATAQYWAGFGDLALHTLGHSQRPKDVALRRHIRHDLVPTVSAVLSGSTDSDRLHIVGVTLNANYHLSASRWLGLAYRVAHLQQHNALIPADNVLYGRELLVSGGQRLGGLHSPVGTLWPSVALGVRKYSNWQTFAWRANAKWIPFDRWRVDFYSGNEVIENIRSIQNRVTFRSADADVSWQALPRINLGVGGGAGVFDDRFGNHNTRWRVRSHLLGVLHMHPRIYAEWNFLYFNDSEPNVQVGYYNPGAYWENHLTVGASYRWRGWKLAARVGGGRLTEEPSSNSDWMYFWQASVGRDLGRAGELRLVAARTDSKQFASSTNAGYSRTYLSLGYIYRF